MSNYTKTTDFAVKDTYASGNPDKAVVGTEFDVEFNNIQTAVNSKIDPSTANAANGYAKLDASALVPAAQIPQATTTAVGGGEAATDAEADAGAASGANSTKLVVASNLASVLTQAAGSGINYAAGVLNLTGNLADIGGLAVTNGNFIVGNGTNWVAESGATARASLGLTIGTDVQAFGAHLDDLSALGAVSGADRFMVSSAAGVWAYETAATAATTLGVGTASSPQFAAVNLSHATQTTLSGSAGQVLVEGKGMLQHNGSYTSGEVFFSTVAPTTQGDNGDIYFEYTA